MVSQSLSLFIITVTMKWPKLMSSFLIIIIKKLYSYLSSTRVHIHNPSLGHALLCLVDGNRCYVPNDIDDAPDETSFVKGGVSLLDSR